MYNYNLGLHFQHIVSEYKDKAAIVFCDGSQISFTELNCLSNKIANFLISQNVIKNNVVAIQNDKTSFGFATMLACLKLGIIYTNIDTSSPKERLNKVFDTAMPALVVSDTAMISNVAQICEERKIPTFDYLNNTSSISEHSEDLSDCIIRSATGANPAYIMFTSGSTGVPKGVLIKQESVLNFINWAQDVYQLDHNDVMTNVNPVYFDNSVFDFYCSLFNGVTLVVFPKSIIEQPKKMLDIIDKTHCTLWFSVPSFLIYLYNIKLLTKDSFKSMRGISFGGEGYPKNSLKKLYNLFSDRASFYNIYGPTEGTCICSAYKIKSNDFDDMSGLVTLGRLAPNFDYLILDSDNKPSRAGELCLIGSQLAIGYYNDKERTQKSFVNNPINSFFEQKMYKTGDLVEEKEDGLLYFVGRTDNQIKHMGYRIELEEIESGLIKLAYVKQCAVVQIKTDNSLSKLVAYIATDLQLEEKIIREDLRHILPSYMVPNMYELVDNLPKNPNGKVDRVKLKSSALSSHLG